MKDFMEKQLERTNYWLAFGEAKNAAIVACDVALISACMGAEFVSTSIKLVCCIGYVLSLMLGIISFWPQVRKVFKTNYGISSEDDNLTFYGDVAKFDSGSDYSIKVKVRYHFNEELSKLITDLAEEVVINSKICVFKYKIFSIALVMDVLAVLLTVIMVIVA